MNVKSIIAGVAVAVPLAASAQGGFVDRAEAGWIYDSTAQVPIQMGETATALRGDTGTPTFSRIPVERAGDGPNYGMEFSHSQGMSSQAVSRYGDDPRSSSVDYPLGTRIAQ